MLPRHFSLPLSNATLHGQLLRPDGAKRLLLIPKPHRIAIADPGAQYFLQAGDAVLAAELLTEREAAYAEATQDTARLAARLLHLLEFIREDADTQNLPLALLASDDLTPAALRAAARRDTQVAALVATGGLIDRAGLEALQLLAAPLLFLCPATDHYALAAWQRAQKHLTCPHAAHTLAPGEEATPRIAAWLAKNLPARGA